MGVLVKTEGKGRVDKGPVAMVEVEGALKASYCGGQKASQSQGVGARKVKKEHVLEESRESSRKWAQEERVWKGSRACW